MNLEDGVGDIVHVLLGSQQSTGSGQHGHFPAHLVAVGTVILLAILLQSAGREHFAIGVFLQYVIDPGFLMQTPSDVGAQADPLSPEHLEKSTATDVIEMLFSIGHRVSSRIEYGIISHETVAGQGFL